MPECRRISSFLYFCEVSWPLINCCRTFCHYGTFCDYVVHLLHVLSPFRQQQYNLFFPSLVLCMCVCPCSLSLSLPPSLSVTFISVFVSLSFPSVFRSSLCNSLPLFSFWLAHSFSHYRPLPFSPTVFLTVCPPPSRSIGHIRSLALSLSHFLFLSLCLFDAQTHTQDQMYWTCRNKLPRLLMTGIMMMKTTKR